MEDLYKDGLLTLEHLNAIDNIHQELSNIGDAFHRSDDLPLNQSLQGLCAIFAEQLGVASAAS